MAEGQQRYRFNETLEKEVWNLLCVGQQLEENSTQVRKIYTNYIPDHTRESKGTGKCNGNAADKLLPTNFRCSVNYFQTSAKQMKVKNDIIAPTC